MKYRKGFVTNSSSSSFIIAYKDMNQIYKENKYSNYIKNISELFEQKLKDEEEDVWYSSYEGEIISTEEELKAYFIDHFVFDDNIDNYFIENLNKKNLYESLISYIQNGYKILFREISDCDENILPFIQSMMDNENFIVLEEEKL